MAKHSSLRLKEIKRATLGDLISLSSLQICLSISPWTVLSLNFDENIKLARTKNFVSDPLIGRKRKKNPCEIREIVKYALGENEELENKFLSLWL